MKRIAQRRGPQPDIPTASQGDIAFLLIIFFMVGTTFRASQGLKVILPNAMSTERILKKRNTHSLWLDKTGKVSVNDNLVTIPAVTPVMSERVVENPDLVVVLQADKDVPYGHVTDVLEALKAARALKVTFATNYEMGGGGG
ncbi:biopolymer transporter ExbD [candidate division WOR-3 bacterium]|uniref:Biopolymer transporter ExbD n=1 Tax=candidate division WOR-3 bacterium TaxID=2052148 RepID=A0A937XHZ8_UNCW3|nr:biopolymer transporter ExbD [candidate division WOR-3 bacterium]